MGQQKSAGPFFARSTLKILLRKLMLAKDDLRFQEQIGSSPSLNLPEMSKAKRDLLLRYLSGEVGQNQTSEKSIEPRDTDCQPQLSFGQERLWFVEQLKPGTSTFNVPIAVRLRTSIHHAVLQRSINEIVRRHEVLRTTFAVVDGKPKSLISPDLSLSVPVIDLSDRPTHEIETTLRRLKNDEALRPFDLSVGPLIRAVLIRLEARDHLLLVTMHHIISDGWSMVVFFRELSQLYKAFSDGQSSSLPDLEIQYADYAAWQKGRLQGSLFEKQLSYWTKNLSGDLPVLDLVTGRPRPAIHTNRGARESLRISRDLAQSIVALGQHEGVTLFMSLLAVFKILLARLTGLEDIIVGSPIANRPESETERLIGFFINNLALRTDLSGDPSFRDVLSRVRHTALEAYANQDLPFEKIVGELNPRRDLSRTPIFQIFFNLLNFAEKIQLPGVPGGEVAYVEAWSQSDQPSSQFDMTLYVAELSEELQFVLLYNADIFERDRMTAMLEQFRDLLEQVVSDPSAAISSYSLTICEPKWSLSNPSALPAYETNEINQIESTICEHPSIREAKVVAVDDKSGKKRLVVYVEPSQEVETIINDLRRWVKQRLPDHLIPSEFVVLDELQLTKTGELDQRSLPVVEGKQFQQNAFIAPRNTLELLLAKTWETVLDVRPIGITDDFFDLGGQSLLAIQLFAQIEKVCGKKLPLTTLFQAPTVEQLASVLSEQSSPSSYSLVPIQPNGSKPPLFCLHLALGHVLFYRDLANRLGPSQPVYAFRPQGLDGKQPRHSTIEEMAAHYIKEMRVLQPEGPYYLCGSSFGGLIAFEMAQQLVVDGQEVGLLALFDTHNPKFSKPLPDGQSWLQKTHRVAERVNLHVTNLLLLNSQDKVKYIREKAVLVNSRMKGRLRRWRAIGVVKLVYNRNGNNGHSVISEFEKTNADLKRLRSYRPQVYPGRVTVFRASKQPSGYDYGADLGWEELAAGGVEVYEIHGYHGSIITEPRVRKLAEELQACLSKIHAAYPRNRENVSFAAVQH